MMYCTTTAGQGPAAYLSYSGSEVEVMASAITMGGGGGVGVVC